MRVDGAEEEAIRRASKELNEQLKSYQKRFAIDDRQDLLAMVAFDAWMSAYRAKAAKTSADDLLEARLTQWEGLLAGALLDE